MQGTQESPSRDPRDFTVAERQEKFLRHKAVRLKQRTREAKGWREVDRKMTRNESAELPPGALGSAHRSRTVWVQYFHSGVGAYVASKGYYDIGVRRWMARYEPEELRDLVKHVDAVAWAPVQPGVAPWSGPIIPRRLVDLP